LNNKGSGRQNGKPKALSVGGECDRYMGAAVDVVSG
jgi:hypothetical protein